MPLKTMEHFLVLTEDIDATRDFYVNTLGMTVGFRPPLGFPGYWVYLGDTPCIHIAEWETYTAHSNNLGIPVSSKAQGTGPVDHIAFNGTDYEAMYKKLQHLNVEMEVNHFPDIGLRQIFLDDPNGVKLELNFMPSA